MPLLQLMESGYNGQDGLLALKTVEVGKTLASGYAGVHLMGVSHVNPPTLAMKRYVLYQSLAMTRDVLQPQPLEQQ